MAGMDGPGEKLLHSYIVAKVTYLVELFAHFYFSQSLNILQIVDMNVQILILLKNNIK